MALHGTLQGDQDVTSIVYVGDAGGAILTQTLADNISFRFGEFLDDIKGALHTECHFSGTTITDVRTLGAPQLTSASGFPVDGAGGSGPLPNQNAAQLNLRTDLRGPWYRGRFYISGFQLNANDHSGMTSATFTLLTTELANLKTELQSDTTGFRVVSRHLGGVKRLVALSTVVTHTDVNLLWASLARRRPGK